VKDGRVADVEVVMEWEMVDEDVVRSLSRSKEGGMRRLPAD